MSQSTAELQRDRNSTRPFDPFDAEIICRLSLRRMVVERYSQSGLTSKQRPIPEGFVVGGTAVPVQVDQKYLNMYFYKTFDAPGVGSTKVGSLWTCSVQPADLVTLGQIILPTQSVNAVELTSWQMTGYLGACGLTNVTFPNMSTGEWLLLASGSAPNMTFVYSEHRQENREDAEIASFLMGICLLAESSRVRQAAAKIMDYTDNLLLGSRFDTCRSLLSQVDVGRLAKHPTLLTAFLGITLGAKNELGRTREEFYASIETALTWELGQVRAKNILRRFQ